jgi:hypothetical protein
MQLTPITEVLMNPEQSRPTMKGFKAAHGKLAKSIREAFDHNIALERTRETVPARVAVSEAVKKEIIKLAPERKLLTKLVKMVYPSCEHM